MEIHKSVMKLEINSENSEIHSEIQKSILKSRNPFQNPKIQSEFGNPSQYTINCIHSTYTYIIYLRKRNPQSDATAIGKKAQQRVISR